MSHIPSDTAVLRRRGILFVLGAAGGFSLAAAFAKAVGSGVPVAEVVFCRNIFAVIALMPLMLRQGGWSALRTRTPLGHVWRTIFGLMGMVGAFYGYLHLPLATVTALGFAMPLFLTILSVLFLGERIRWRRSLAVAVGLCGVLLMVRPDAATLGANGLAIGMVLMGTLAWALAMITIRRMGDAGESGATIVLWFAIGSAAVSGLASIPGWVWPSAWQWVFLAGIGIVSAGAQILMTEAYRSGEATLLAPFEYSAIVWTTTLGIAVWGEYPDGWDLAGVAVLVGAGLYIWHREVQLGIRR